MIAQTGTCVVCDTIGCCDEREQHTYGPGCILSKQDESGRLSLFKAELNKVLRETTYQLEQVKLAQRFGKPSPENSGEILKMLESLRDEIRRIEEFYEG